MPCELSDRNARIDSNPDTVHARGALSVSTRGFPHERHVLHDAVFAFGPERPNRLQGRHGAFMRDRSQVPYAKVLTKHDSTKLHQIFVCGVGRKLREACPRRSCSVPACPPRSDGGLFWVVGLTTKGATVTHSLCFVAFNFLLCIVF